MSCQRHLIAARAILTEPRRHGPFEKPRMHAKAQKHNIDKRRRSMVRASMLAVAALFSGKSMDELRSRKG